MPATNTRRTYLIDRPFQLKYILLLAAWGLVLAVLFGLWAWQAHRQAVELLAGAPEQRALLRIADRTLLWALAGIGALSSAALALLGYLMTHRVAGPVWVMGHALGELAQGRYPAKRALRKGDELRSLHERFQAAVEALAVRDRRTLSAIEEALERLRPAVAADPTLQPVVAALESEARSRRDTFVAQA
jgi:hypothetical protein